jgi:hypothetical protein
MRCGFAGIDCAERGVRERVPRDGIGDIPCVNQCSRGRRHGFAGGHGLGDKLIDARSHAGCSIRGQVMRAAHRSVHGDLERQIGYSMGLSTSHSRLDLIREHGCRNPHLRRFVCWGVGSGYLHASVQGCRMGPVGGVSSTLGRPDHRMDGGRCVLGSRLPRGSQSLTYCCRE